MSEKEKISLSNEYCAINSVEIKVNQYEVYLNNEIREPKNYVNLLQLLRTVTENDEIKVYINNHGGQLNTMIQIINGMNNCKAPVTTIADGAVHSAASILLLNGDVIEVTEDSYMLCHFYSAGTHGKGNEILEDVNFNNKHLRAIYGKHYEGFLTDSELESLFEGKDYWFNSQEICKRLDKRNRYFKKKCKEEKEEDVTETSK